MENQDVGYNISRRAPDLEDYLDMARRQKAWIIGPMFAALVVSCVVAFAWPDTYVSTAVVRVTPPQVPEAFVPTNVNLEMSQRINAMAQQILSRSTLTNIINTYNLYPREKARLPMEDVVEEMRRDDVRISNVVSYTPSEGRRQVPAFQISFSYENRILAQKVCQELVTKFINENTRDRANQSVFTTQFLKDQLEMARRDLQVVEDKLAQFRVNNAGKLPDQVQQNLQQLSALEARLGNLNAIVGRANQEKLLLENQLRITKEQMTSLGSPTEQITVQQQQQAQVKNDRLARLENEIMALETRIAALKETYTEAHPDVKSHISALGVLKRQRDSLEKQEAAREAAEASKKKPDEGPQKRIITNPNIVREQREMDSIVKRLQGLMEAKDLEMEEARREAQRIDALIRTTQSRIDATPLGEKEYMELLRDRELVRQRVDDLNKKQSVSGMATALESRQQGENLELLDPASIPQKPSQPQRPIIIGAGTAIGLFLGIVLAGAREVKDSSLKNLKDVRAYTQMNILGSIPLLENDLVVRRRRRLGWLAWSTATIVGVMIMSGSMYYYYFLAKV